MESVVFTFGSLMIEVVALKQEEPTTELAKISISCYLIALSATSMGATATGISAITSMQRKLRATV